MVSTADIESLFFRRLTGREKPALQHPTSNRFDAAAWLLAAEELPLTSSPRDLELMLVAVLINRQVRVLRDQILGPIFEGMSAHEIVTMAIANANRGFAVLQQKAEEAREALGPKSSAHISSLSHILVQPYEGGSPATPDDLHNSVVDALPHWFALAAGRSNVGTADEESFGTRASQGAMGLSLEYVFRSIWQEVLWDRWSLSSCEDGFRLDPLDPEWEANWRIWELRQQSLLLQGSMLNQQLEKSMSTPREPVLDRTIVSYDAAVGQRIALGAPEPEPEQTISHLWSVDNLNSAYTAIFLDQEVGGVTGMTTALLSRVVMILQDLATKALPADFDVPTRVDRDWITRVACTTPRRQVVEAVASALNLDLSLADASIDFLSVDPYGPLSDLFVTGLWHRPLISVNGGVDLLIAVGPLVWGSPIRRLERWLQFGPGSDLSKTPIGLRYEAAVRAKMTAAVAANHIFNAATARVSCLPPGMVEEEIDMLIRIGSTLLVCEVKCLLGPSEPIERNDYLRKLEGASAQARRKAKWIQARPDLVKSRLGSWGEESLRVLPLVVVNQSNGIGAVIGACHVTDAHFLEIFLGDGSYYSGAAFNVDSPGSISFIAREIYGSVSEAQTAIPDVFAHHPGLQAWRDAIMWRDNRVPLSGGLFLSMASPFIDVAAYATAAQQAFGISPVGS